LILTLSVFLACAEEAPADRDVGPANGGDDDNGDDDTGDDDGDDQGDDDVAEPPPSGTGTKDAGRADAGKLDGGAGPSTRVDAAKPPVDVPANSDGGKAASDASSSTASDASQSSGDSDASSGGEERADLGKGDGKDVVTIGDSWMLLLGTGIQESLTKTSGQPYRKYARPGTKLLDGVIPGQYATAKRADADIKTVVMTAGGNDVIQNATLKADCMSGGTACEAQVDKIRMALSDLWKQMSTDGVQDVIHVMYSASAGSGVKNRDAHNKKMAEVCAAVPAPLRCHLLNTDMLIGPSEMRGDGIHPTDPGYDKIGKAVFELMTEKGMRR
jgi:hypothetical protein